MSGPGLGFETSQSPVGAGLSREKDTAVSSTGRAGDRGNSPLPQGLGWPLDVEQERGSYQDKAPAWLSAYSAPPHS